ncbi:M42 family metallopeptidase [Vulcanisaeta sp. JCM 16159]|uniref:M42 family metallopeptidase n=1 Tax=Vulcanisaeta sp. JCM 16159 TaxID=1295371 RepID=UPI0006D06994|nr:M42 family metallopeptidase [Vulcanisaeta sp. JCM 16159]
MDIDILGRLSMEIGPSGFEDRVRRVIRGFISDYVDDIMIDNMGNLIARVGNGPFKVLISAHMDEVGVMVSHIDQRGFLRIIPIGGLDPWTLLDKELAFMGRSGDIVGVVGVDPPHLRKEKPPSRFEELYVDAGFSSKDEALKNGIMPGTPGTFIGNFRQRGSVAIGKAFDNRVGCTVLIDTLRDIRNKVSGDVSLYFSWNTQEEVGLRGINAVVHQVNPHMAFIVETTVAADVPTSSEDVWITRIGGGAALRAYDRSMIANPRLLSAAIELAESNNVKYQVQVNPYGGTDAGIVHTYGTGVPSLVISTPARYIHSPASLINVEDLRQVENLLRTLLLNLDLIRSKA